MKRFAFVAVLVMALLAAGAVAAFAAPNGPGLGFGPLGGMMGGAQGAPYGYGMMGGGWGHMGGRMMGDDLEALLGISHADIHAAHVAGKSLVDIAAEKDVTEDQLIAALLDGREAALAQAVEDGKLTQGTADEMLQFMAANIRTMVEAKGMFAMMGGLQGVPYGMMGDAQRAPRTGGCHGAQTPASSVEI